MASGRIGGFDLDLGAAAVTMATESEGFAAWFTQALGGWSSPDEVTGTAYDAYEESVQRVQTVAEARGWDSSTAMDGYNILSAAYTAAIDGDVVDADGNTVTSADAEAYWLALLGLWPADALVPGWNELGQTWESYANWSRGIYDQAVESVETFLEDVKADAGAGIDWRAVAKYAAAGGAIGFAGAIATKANTTNGMIGGGMVGGLWELVAQSE